MFETSKTIIKNQNLQNRLSWQLDRKVATHKDPINRSITGFLQYGEFCHIDANYSGLTNNSHYRQGFGIVQTIDFHSFLGHFRNGRAEGLGLIIFCDGSLVYGHFSKDRLNGLGIFDDGEILKVGTWNNEVLNGIGYEYHYETYVWKMVRYFKGQVAQTLKQEVRSINSSIPALLNLEKTIFTFLVNFLEHNYFCHEQFDLNNYGNGNKISYSSDQNRISCVTKQVKQHRKDYVTLQKVNIMHFGLIENGKEERNGLKYDMTQRKVIEAGYYVEGRLNGWGFKNNALIRHKEIGFYRNDAKEGLFLHEDGGKISYYLYRHNVFLESVNGIQNRIEFIRTKQRQYNYNQKSFISQKNSLNLANFFRNFRVNQYQSLNQLSPERNSPKDELQEILKKAEQNKKKPKPKIIERNPDYVSSINIIKQKMRLFDIGRDEQEQFENNTANNFERIDNLSHRKYQQANRARTPTQFDRQVASPERKKSNKKYQYVKFIDNNERDLFTNEKAGSLGQKIYEKLPQSYEKFEPDSPEKYNNSFEKNRYLHDQNLMNKEKTFDQKQRVINGEFSEHQAVQSASFRYPYNVLYGKQEQEAIAQENSPFKKSALIFEENRSYGKSSPLGASRKKIRSFFQSDA